MKKNLKKKGQESGGEGTQVVDEGRGEEGGAEKKGKNTRFRETGEPQLGRCLKTGKEA